MQSLCLKLWWPKLPWLCVRRTQVAIDQFQGLAGWVGLGSLFLPWALPHALVAAARPRQRALMQPKSWAQLPQLLYLLNRVDATAASIIRHFYYTLHKSLQSEVDCTARLVRGRTRKAEHPNTQAQLRSAYNALIPPHRTEGSRVVGISGLVCSLVSQLKSSIAVQHG